MKLLRRALAAFWSLFVDDALFAAAIVIWIGVGGLLLRQLPRGMAGPILFIGLALLVALSMRPKSR